MSSPDEQRQALSAFTDSQTDDLESRRTAAALLNDPDLQNTWRRFHLIGALLRNEVAQADSLRNTGSREATLRLRAALAQEVPLPVEAATLSAAAAEARSHVGGTSPRDAALNVRPDEVQPGPVQSTGRRWYAAGLGLATAAGLAAGMWVTTPGGLLAQPSSASAQLAAGLDTRTGQGQVLPIANAGQQVDAQRRARLYMLMHAQQAGLSQASQGISMVKFVSYGQSADDHSNNNARHNSER